MGDKAPDKVLNQLYVTLETLKSKGDNLAAEIQKRLRIIVSIWINLQILIFLSYTWKCTYQDLYCLYSVFDGSYHLSSLKFSSKIRLQVEMELLAGFLEWSQILNYLIRHQLLQCH